MALQIWLPLNGTTKNQGLLGELTVSSPTYYVDGKLGKAMHTGAIKMSAEQTAQVLNNDEVSIAFWVYVNAETGSTTNRGMFFGNEGMGVKNNNRKFSLFQYPTCNDFHYSWMNDDSSYTFAVGVLSGVLPSYKWTHVAVVYKNPTIKVFINGTLKHTATGNVSNSSSFAYDTQVIYNNQCHYFNDYRVYNNAISEKEVKEISKGLVCHYKLSGCGGENYFVNSNDGVSYTSTENSTYADVRMLINNDFWTKDNHNNYVVSFDWEISKPLSEITYCNLHWCNHPWYSLKTLVIPENTTSGHYEYSGNNIPSEDYSTDNIFVRIGSTSGTADSWLAKNPGITFKLTNYKLEIGSKSTPWCPNPSDSLYSTLGYNDGIEYDCSGYGNNGTKVGNIAWSGDTARYSGSYYFPTNAYINCGKGGKIKDGITVNIWCYMDKWNDNIDLVCCTENGGWEIYNRNSHPTFNVFIPDIGYVTASSSKLWSDLSSGWHMFTGSYDGFNIKLYIDGILESSVSNGKSSKTSIYYNSTNSIYIHAESAVPTPVTGYDACKLSDCRIYATALSEEDVKSLYSVSASIDKTGVLFCAEVMEN